MDYSRFSVEELVMDGNFQKWVRKPDGENAAFWTEWLRAHPHKAEEVRQARLIILGMDFKKTPASEVPRELLLKKIRMSIAAMNERPVTSRPISINRYYRIAAVFLGLVVSTATLYFLTATNMTQYATAFAETRQITLPDGSTMVLNANSSVRFEDDWSPNEPREVWLHGEAFFDIRHLENDERFVVRTNNLDVEVLGTEFNVQTRKERVQVVLRSGRVKLNTTGSVTDSLYLEPGELAELSTSDQKLTKKVVNPEEFCSWRNNELIFKATPLSEIAETLHHNYGWNITFEDEAMKSSAFTGTVSTESVENVELLLVTISEAFGFDVVKENDQIVFSRK